MIPACLPPREVSRPKVPPPPNACDTHAHGVRARGDFSLRRRPQLHAAGCAARDVSRHARPNRICARRAGTGQRAWPRQFRDAGRTGAPPDRLRGVAVAEADISHADLREWNRLGVRGLRFNHFFRDGQLHYRGGVPLTAAEKLAPVMAELGWHLQLWIDVKDLPATIPALKSLGLPVVIDHMGRTDARAGIATEGFQSLPARGRRRLVLGQTVRRPPPQPRRARLSRRAAVS